MKKTRRTVMYILLVTFMVFPLSACSQAPEESLNIQEYEDKIEILEGKITNLGREKAALETAVSERDTTISNLEAALAEALKEPDLPEITGQIRVFESGKANIWLFPEGIFVANLYHNTKITGTFTEMTQGNETALLFTYHGIHKATDGVSSFNATGQTTVVGGIVNGVLTIPEDWDDGHGHGNDFVYKDNLFEDDDDDCGDDHGHDGHTCSGH